MRVRLVLVLLVVMGLLLTVSETAQAANPDATRWDVYKTFLSKDGDDVPLRHGRHDSPAGKGFGKYHIEDKHGSIPPPASIQHVLETGKCKYEPINDAYTCTGFDQWKRLLRVVYTTRVDHLSGDGRPVGIITAYALMCPCRGLSDD